MEKLPGVDNPIYEMQPDIVEVKENIYSTIQENLSATLDSAADNSDLWTIHIHNRIFGVFSI